MLSLGNLNKRHKPIYALLIGSLSLKNNFTTINIIRNYIKTKNKRKKILQFDKSGLHLNNSWSTAKYP